jgi:KDO2-lipid IV(A) lauroyltransferase
MFFNAVELMRMPKVTRAWVERVTDYGDIEKAKAMLGAGQGAILVVPHSGNWDLAGVSAQLFGLPMFFVVGRQRNPLVDEWLNRMRGITGIETIPRDASALKKVIKNLRAGKVLAFMTDLRSKTPAMRVRFLGKEANVVGGMGLFARQAGVPVLPAVVTRVGWGRHRWRAFEAVRPDPAAEKEADRLRMTQQVIDIYDRFIREEPDQYFWYNKRWVLDPLEEVTLALTRDRTGHRSLITGHRLPVTGSAASEPSPSPAARPGQTGS